MPCLMVKEQTEMIDSRFLEPACDNGNFLVEVFLYQKAIQIFENEKVYSPYYLTFLFFAGLYLPSKAKDSHWPIKKIFFNCVQ